nr:hypothetical protein CFP56_52541 [Quercus suber]
MISSRRFWSQRVQYSYKASKFPEAHYPMDQPRNVCACARRTFLLSTVDKQGISKGIPRERPLIEELPSGSTERRRCNPC